MSSAVARINLKRRKHFEPAGVAQIRVNWLIGQWLRKLDFGMCRPSWVYNRVAPEMNALPKAVSLAAPNRPAVNVPSPQQFVGLLSRLPRPFYAIQEEADPLAPTLSGWNWLCRLPNSSSLIAQIFRFFSQAFSEALASQSLLCFSTNYQRVCVLIERRLNSDFFHPPMLGVKCDDLES